MHDRILAALIASLLWVFTPPAQAQSQSQDKFAGAYRVSIIQVFHIRTDGDTLILRPSFGPQMTLMAQGQGRFMETMSNAQFVFSEDGATLTATNVAWRRWRS